MFCECRNIVVRHGQAIVLDVPHASIDAQRITAVVGANGAGKTTLLEVMALLRRPTNGDVHLWGRAASRGDRRLRDTVVMTTQPGYLFSGTVWHNVTYGLRARHTPRRDARRRAAEVLDLVGLGEFQHRDVHGLSAGERQRINLARALAVRPKALLLDEPTANVDSQTVEIVADVLRKLRDDDGMTVVYASPTGDRFPDITDAVVELSDGRLAS